MKTHLKLLFLLVSLPFLIANAQNDCAPPLAQKDLNINNVRARLTTGGDLWSDSNGPKYIVPNVEPGQTEVASLYAGSLWIGGLDDGGNLKLAAQTYGRPNKFDYYPGPFDIDEFPQTDMENCLNWDKFFSMSSTLVAQHKADFEDNEMIDGPIPTEILGWPARGNASFVSVHGFELPDAELAPFLIVMKMDYMKQNWAIIL